MRGARTFATAVLCLLAAPAEAHRGHDALTTVTIDAKGGIIVAHEFEAHDIEPALSQIAPDAQPSLDDPEAVAALVSYLARRFTIADQKGAIALKPIRQEIGAERVSVSFAGRLRASPKTLVVSSCILLDVYPRQINQVNVRKGKIVRTLTFTGSAPQTVSLR